MQKAVLLSRRAAGLDTDCYKFRYGRKIENRYYGDRLIDAQAVSLFLHEQQRGKK